MSALDHWHTWASGRPVTAEQLQTITDALGVDHGQRRGELAALHGALQPWAVHNHIELHPTLAPPVRQIERDLGLSL